MNTKCNVTTLENEKNKENVTDLRIVENVTKSILDLTEIEAKKFFLKTESYCSFELPPYFNFTSILSDVDKILHGKDLFVFRLDKPRKFNDLNYKIMNNKDGRYSWRPIQLIHPAIYVSLIHKITTADNWKKIRERYFLLTENPKIECLSIPRVSLSENSDKAEQITHWWNKVEQRSIELAIDFDHLTHTDITDCYGSMYTHSIVWALHGKTFAKEEKLNKDLIGNIIDTHLQDMSHGQTNGIPQGSTLMDFIAEMVLGYADMLLTEKIDNKIRDYKILRYRDDYRIFVNNPRDGEMIIKHLTEVMIDLGLKLSANKTSSSNNVIKSSIKSDKLFWMKQKQFTNDLQAHFLIIHDLSYKHPNSGSLIKTLQKYHKRLLKKEILRCDVKPLISIAVDIAYNNPRAYPSIAAIISLLLTSIKSEDQKINMINKMRKKLNNIPNTGHLEIWLQRVTLGFREEYNYEEPLCQLTAGKNINIWNVEWLNNKLKKAIKSERIIDKKSIPNLSVVIQEEEIQLFNLHSL